MYLKLNNGVIEKYPYTVNELRKENPETSFPKNIPESLLNEFGVFKVENTPTDVVGIGKFLFEGQPELVDGVWKQVWLEGDLPYEEQLAKVLDLRARSYPPMSDYVDGVVKGDQAQIDKYVADCLAVKAKYPKPTEV